MERFNVPFKNLIERCPDNYRETDKTKRIFPRPDNFRGRGGFIQNCLKIISSCRTNGQRPKGDKFKSSQ